MDSRFTSVQRLRWLGSSFRPPSPVLIVKMIKRVKRQLGEKINTVLREYKIMTQIPMFWRSGCGLHLFFKTGLRSSLGSLNWLGQVDLVQVKHSSRAEPRAQFRLQHASRSSSPTSVLTKQRYFVSLVLSNVNSPVFMHVSYFDCTPSVVLLQHMTLGFSSVLVRQSARVAYKS